MTAIRVTEGVVDAQYIVLQPDPDLPNARQLITGSGIIITDNPASGTLSIAIDPSYVFQSLFVWNEVPSGSVNGSNASFSLANIPAPQTALMFFVNGVLQLQGPTADFTLTGSLINLTYPPRVNSNLLASYPK
jgi:hypothetical protein